MAGIIFKREGITITPEDAMKWFCWHELVSVMSKQHYKILQKAIYTVEQNIPDWEMRVLKKYLELSEDDLIV